MHGLILLYMCVFMNILLLDRTHAHTEISCEKLPEAKDPNCLSVSELSSEQRFQMSILYNSFYFISASYLRTFSQPLICEIIAILCCCQAQFDTGFPAAFKNVLCHIWQVTEAATVKFFMNFFVISHENFLMPLSSFVGGRGGYHREDKEISLSVQCMRYSERQSLLPLYWGANSQRMDRGRW